jgi:CHAT domain-containing protein
MVRYEGRVAVTPLPRLARGEIKVAAILADVEDPAYPRLDLDREELNLRKALDGVARVETDFWRPGTVAQLEGALDKELQVLHFAGHGDWQTRMGEKPGSVEGTGRLILATEERGARPQEVGQLAASLRARGVRLAVLGACEGARRDAVNPWTGIAPALVREGIPAVIGMQYSVRDANAIVRQRFYDQLAGGGDRHGRGRGGLRLTR